MTTVGPAASLAQFQAQTALAMLAVVSADAPEELAKLPAGTLLDAKVAGEATRNTLTLSTEAGTVTVKLPPGLQVPADAKLTLQLTLQGGQPAFRLVAVNGRPLPGGPAAAIFNAPNPLAAGLLLAGEARAQLPPGAPQPAMAGAAATATVATPAPAAGLTATVIRPAAPPLPGSVAPTPSALSGQPAAAPPGPAAPALPPALADLPAGTTLTVRIATAAPQAAPQPAGQAPTAAAVPGQPVPAAAPPAPAAPSPAQPAPLPS
ncbi:MAG: hypothetical protein ACM31L_19580, partial [Actinomycetota bacterium]